MMPFMRFPEPSLTTGFVGTRLLMIEISPSPTPSHPSDEEVDYSGHDFDFDDEPAFPDTSKFPCLTIEEGRLLL